MEIPLKQIRATYNDTTIRVYQAYNDAIADSALENGRFVSPSFKFERMTWIKPSFLWMMYRSGWGLKECGQSRILAIDISKEGFNWALAHSCLSHQAKSFKSRAEWLAIKNVTPVRIQWDPERDLNLDPLEHRTIQIGLSKQAIKLYVEEWTHKISDVTEVAKQIYMLVKSSQMDEAMVLLPKENVYPVDDDIANKIQLTLRPH
jgi:hypothetical protein